MNQDAARNDSRASSTALRQKRTYLENSIAFPVFPMWTASVNALVTLKTRDFCSLRPADLEPRRLPYIVEIVFLRAFRKV